MIVLGERERREIECVVWKRRMRSLGSDLNSGEDMDGC